MSGSPQVRGWSSQVRSRSVFGYYFYYPRVPNLTGFYLWDLFLSVSYSGSMSLLSPLSETSGDT